MTKAKSNDEPAATVASIPHVRTAVLAITAKMAAAGIGKDRKNTQQGGGYNFRGIDDVLNALAGEYVTNKIVVLPSYTNRAATEFTSKAGGRMVDVTIEGTYKLVSLVDGSELVSGPFIGEAMDSGDKATNKAMSVAYKYFAIQTFSIPVVGNEDPDYESPQIEAKGGAKKQQPVASKTQALPATKAPPADESVKAAIDRLSSTKDGRKKLTSIICGAYGIVTLDQLPDDKRAEAVQRLETYVAKAKQAA